MNERPPSRWDQHDFKALLISFGAGALLAALLAQLTSSARWIQLVLYGLAVACLVLIFRRAAASFLRAVWGFLRLQWKLLLLITAINLLVVLLGRPHPPLPEEVLNARHTVIEIQSRFPQARSLLFLDKRARQGQPGQIWMEGYDILAIEGEKEGVLRTYVRHGKRIAEDVEVRDPYPFARRYYQGRCNFATDYFDRSGLQAYLEYRQGCRGGAIIVDPESPHFVFNPLSFPNFGYR